MKLTDDSQLYLSTNQGCFYSLHPAVDRCTSTITTTTTTSDSSYSSSSSQPAWRLLYSSPRKAAITCMQILHSGRQLPPHNTTASSTASLASSAQKRNTHWAVFGDGVGVVTCLEIEVSIAPQSSATVSSKHTQSFGSGLHQDPQHLPAVAQDRASQPAQTSSRQASGLRAQVSDAQNSGFGSQGPSKRGDSGQCASPQPEWQTQPCLTSSLSSFSWAAHQGSPVLAIFHPTNFGLRHVFTTSIAGAPMRWWLLTEHTLSSAAPGGAADTQASTQSEHAATSAVAAWQSRATAADSNPLLGYASLSSPGQQQLSTGQVTPQLLAEVTPIPGRGSQIVAMDACWSRRLLVCGDMAGNVMAFTIPHLLLQERPAAGESEFECGCRCECGCGGKCDCECECRREEACEWECECGCWCELCCEYEILADWQGLLLHEVQALNWIVSDYF